MFYIFRSSWAFLKAASHAAQLENPPDEIMLSGKMWETKRLDFAFPLLKFSIHHNAKLLDNFVNGTSFNLYSDKLISILRELKIDFDAFPVELVDRKTNKVILEEYFIFHLLESFEVFDKNLSDITPTRRIKRLVVSREFEESGKLMVRDKDFRQHIVVHQHFKDTLDNSGVTGCDYISVEEFAKPRQKK
jgi:hypothetical protein